MDKSKYFRFGMIVRPTLSWTCIIVKSKYIGFDQTHVTSFSWAAQRRMHIPLGVPKENGYFLVCGKG